MIEEYRFTVPSPYVTVPDLKKTTQVCPTKKHTCRLYKLNLSQNHLDSGTWIYYRKHFLQDIVLL